MYFVEIIILLETESKLYEGGNMTDAISYFDKVVLEYSVGDIKELLKNRGRCAGPLLSVIANGIDLLGGICFGFTAGSNFRSVEFMKTHMNIRESLAKVLYSCVRCGCVHQGMPKIGLKFFVLYDRLQEGVFVYKDSEGYLWLNVTEFAYRYLDAINKIANDKNTFILHYPPLTNRDATTFIDATTDVVNDIQELADAIHDEDQAEEYAKLERGEIESMSSDSMYLPNGTINTSIVLPPEE